MAGRATNLYLSTVLGKNVINSRGAEIGKLMDLVMVSGERFPEVSLLLVRSGNEVYRIPWQRVTVFNRFVITVTASTRHLPKYERAETEILLKRDLLDKQIVDVNGAKVVRVNDLKLGNYKRQLCVFFVDIGFRGILRRMGCEEIVERIASFLHVRLLQHHIRWEYVQLLEANLSRLTLKVARDQLKELHPADLAEIISNLPTRSVAAVLDTLDQETAGEAIHELDPELRTRVVSQMTPRQACEILGEMALDEAADVLGDLPDEKAQELLGMMEMKDAVEIQELMEHEEDTAGALMNSEFIAVPATATVDEALQEVRRRAMEVDTINYLYVVKEDEILEGVVSLRELLVNDPDKKMQDLMNRNLRYVRVDSPSHEVLEVVAKYNFVAVPVLDGRKMEGIISVDDVLEEFVPGVRRRHRRTG